MHSPPRQSELKDLAVTATSSLSASEIKSILGQPVIIVSAPRSGSNLLFEQLARLHDFWTIGGESHVIYSAFPHLRAANSDFDSGSLGKQHADRNTRQKLRACFLFLLRDCDGRPYLAQSRAQRLPFVRLLEKTPRNALNIPFLRELFPKSKFIFLHRDPRSTVASLIEAWKLGLQSGRFVTYPDLPGWDRAGWCFLLPPGWRRLLGRPLSEIAAFQWQTSNRIVMEELRKMGARQWISISYQDLVAEPHRELSRLGRFVGIQTNNVSAFCTRPALSRTTLTPPHPDKWKVHQQSIDPLLPGLLETADEIARFCRGNDTVS